MASDGCDDTSKFDRMRLALTGVVLELKTWNQASDLAELGAAATRECKKVAPAGSGSPGPTRADSA
jgi:hypothetical protein